MSFLILMMIIHGRTRAVPRKLSLKRLSEMAVLVDYYECYEAVELFSDMWVPMEQRHIPISLTLKDGFSFLGFFSGVQFSESRPTIFNVMVKTNC